jgi:putative FmdB family regulatory protein
MPGSLRTRSEKKLTQDRRNIGSPERGSGEKKNAMPIYTYQCTNCGVEFDQHQTFSDPPLVKCPECGKKSLRKVFTPAGIIFKGHGWYATDHRSPSGGVNVKKDKPEGSGGNSADSGTAGGAEKKVESKTGSAAGDSKT